MKKYLSSIFSNFLYATLIIITAAILGYVCLIAVYSLPTQSIRQNALTSAQTFLKNGDVYVWPKKVAGNKIDNYTPALMLNMASFQNRYPAYKEALLNPRVEYINASRSAELFFATQENTPPKEQIINYARYWHGYLIFIKPLLIIGDITIIRIINALCQMTLLLFALYLIYKRLNIKQALAFLTAILFLNPISTTLSVSYGSTYIIMLTAVIILLTQQKKFKIWQFFLSICIITAYFDTLTAPLITLGFPLIIYTLLQKTNLRKDLIKIISNSIAWGYGYLGMWLAKWILASTITDENVIKDGFNNALYRTLGHNGQEIVKTKWSFAIALRNNFAELWYSSSALIILTYLLLICLSYFIKKYRLTKDYRAILLLFIGTYPFFWYIVMMNHSIIHPLLSYRGLAITIYTLTASITICLKSSSQTKLH
jgi:hypothetical protein